MTRLDERVLPGSPDGTPGLAATSRRAVVALWHELPITLLAGTVEAITAIPVLIALFTAAPPWIVAIAAFPLALMMTSLSRFVAAVARSERPRLLTLTRVDPVLAIAGTLAVAAIGLALDGPGSWPLAGAVGAAVLLLTTPLILAYAAMRGRSGFAALRGGLILVGYRPGWALSLSALACLGGFVVAASAGVLLVVVPTVVLVIADAAVGGLLSRIDAVQDVP